MYNYLAILSREEGKQRVCGLLSLRYPHYRRKLQDLKESH